MPITQPHGANSLQKLILSSGTASPDFGIRYLVMPSPSWSAVATSRLTIAETTGLAAASGPLMKLWPSSAGLAPWAMPLPAVSQMKK